MNHQNVYDAIIKKAKSENRKRLTKNQKGYVYYEEHHIIPLCLNGENESENLVLLTGREHFVCHKLLTYIYKGNRKIALAFHKMSFGIHNKNYKISSKDYEYARELIALNGLSQETKDKIRESHVGSTISQETKDKLSKALKGIKKSKETRAKMSLAQKGIIPWNKGKKNCFSDEALNKMREAANKRGPVSEETREKLRVSSHKRKFIKCEYCGKEFDPGNFGKWHGEKCKNKK